MRKVRVILLFSALWLTACGQSISPSSPTVVNGTPSTTGYHKVLTGNSGNPAYTVISLQGSTVQFTKYYLNHGTYSIDTAEWSKNGPLNFDSSSDCASNLASQLIKISYLDSKSLSYFKVSSPAVNVDFQTTSIPLSGVDLSRVPSFNYDPSFCD